MIEGYPERVCDYCHLQLNTFYAFVKKAKSSSKQFERILHRAETVDDIPNYEIAESENGDAKSVDVEYYVDKTELLSDDQIVLPDEDDGIRKSSVIRSICIFIVHSVFYIFFYSVRLFVF